MGNTPMDLTPLESYALIVGFIFVIWAALFLPDIIRRWRNDSKKKKVPTDYEYWNYRRAEWITKKAIEIANITNTYPKLTGELLLASSIAIETDTISQILKEINLWCEPGFHITQDMIDDMDSLVGKIR